jgi:hypothetical protein
VIPSFNAVFLLSTRYSFSSINPPWYRNMHAAKASRGIGRVLKAATAYFKVLPRQAPGVGDINHDVLLSG